MVSGFDEGARWLVVRPLCKILFVCVFLEDDLT